MLHQEFQHHSPASLLKGPLLWLTCSPAAEEGFHLTQAQVHLSISPSATWSTLSIHWGHGCLWGRNKDCVFLRGMEAAFILKHTFIEKKRSAAKNKQPWATTRFLKLGWLSGSGFNDRRISSIPSSFTLATAMWSRSGRPYAYCTPIFCL